MTKVDVVVVIIIISSSSPSRLFGQQGIFLAAVFVVAIVRADTNAPCSVTGTTSLMDTSGASGASTRCCRVLVLGLW